MAVDYAAAWPVLDQAADLIERDGWAVGFLQTNDGCRCVHGAISFAAIGHAEWVEIPGAAVNGFSTANRSAQAAILGLHEYLSADPQPYNFHRRRSFTPDNDLAAWNDGDAMTADRVVAALRTASRWSASRAGEGHA